VARVSDRLRPWSVRDLRPWPVTRYTGIVIGESRIGRGV